MLHSAAMSFDDLDATGIDDPCLVLAGKERGHTNVGQGGRANHVIGSELVLCHPARQRETLVREIPE